MINIRKATAYDISVIVQMTANDALGKTKVHFQTPIPKVYLMALENIIADRIKVFSGEF